MAGIRKTVDELIRRTGATSPFDTRHLPQMQETFGTQWVPHAGRPKKKRDTLTPKLRAAERLLRNHGYVVQEPIK